MRKRINTQRYSFPTYPPTAVRPIPSFRGRITAADFPLQRRQFLFHRDETKFLSRRNKIFFVKGGFCFIGCLSGYLCHRTCVLSILPIAIRSFQLFSCVRMCATPWTAAHQDSLSITNSQSLLKLKFIKSPIPSNNLILCHGWEMQSM